VKYYTLIGSRETPEDILNLMTKAAKVLSEQRWIGRSGGADGADKCLEVGCCDPSLMEIYLPWNGFNKLYSDKVGYIDTPKLPCYPEAQDLAQDLHPNWEVCKKGAKALHTRNCMQVLGRELNTPSKFVLCWGIPVGEDGNVKGGTGQACRLAIKNDVPIMNLYYGSVQQRILSFIGQGG